MKKKEERKVWEKTSRSIFERFAVQLEAFSAGGELPEGGDRDVQYGLELQRRRLEEKELTMEYEMVPRGHFADGGGPTRTWSDDHYMSRMECRTVQLTRNFARNGKKVFREKKNMIFYQIITNVHDQEAAAKDLYTCPNCGAISSIGTLQDGCPFCGTFYKISDLFPKVTNYYFIEDSGGTSGEIKGEIKKSMIPWMLLSFVGYSIFFYLEPDAGGNLLFALLKGLPAGVVFGGILGYLIWAFRKLGGVFVNAGRAVPMLVNMKGSAKKFVEQMQKYSPEFSFEYFSGKVVSYLKMLIFARNAQDLPCYTGETLKDLFQHIVESSYRGATALKKFRVKKDTCYVTVDVYMENIYDSGKRPYRKYEKFRVSLKRNIAKPVSLYFSIKNIQCKGCGGSFDATKIKDCPHCGRLYDMEEDDWIIEKIEKH